MMEKMTENNKLDKNDSENEEENKSNENNAELESKVEMTSLPRKFYTTRLKAEMNRRKGERIYHRPEKGFYIRRPQQRKSFLEKLLGW